MASGFNVAINIQTTGAPAASSALGKVGSSAASAQVKVSGLTGGFKALSLAMQALPIAFLVREIAQAVQQFDRINAALRVAAGSSAGAAREFGFIRKEAERLGLDLASSAEAYSKFGAAMTSSGMSLQLARKGFTAVAEASAALGLSADQSKNALKALEQMVSKGKVSAEELRGQFGEQIPGAFAMAARSMGVTTAQLNKMLETGQVTADVMLPKLFEEMSKTFGPEAERNAHNLSGEINRMHTNLDQLAVKAGGEMAQSVGLLNKALKFVIDNFGHIRGAAAVAQAAVVRAAKFMGDAMIQMSRMIAEPLEKLGALAEAFGGPKNPLRGWTDGLDTLRAEFDQFMDNLAEGFDEVAVEQIADDMQQTAAAAADAAANIQPAAAATDALAEAAARARREFEGIRAATVLGAVPNVPLGGAPVHIESALMRTIEDMADKLNETMVDFDQGMVDGGKRIESVWKGMAKSVGQVFIGVAGAILSGSLRGGQAIGGALGAGVGAAFGDSIAKVLGMTGSFGGPLGALLGSTAGGFAGAALGDLFKGSRPFGGANFGATGGLLGLTGTNANKHGDLAQMQQIGKQLTGAVNDILQGLGATLEGLNKDIGFIVRDGNALVNVNGVQKDFGKNFQEATEFFILEVIRSAELSGLSETVLGAIRAAAQQAGGDLSAFQRDLGAIQEIEGFGKTAAQKAMEELDRHFEDLRATAERLGLDLGKVNAEYETQRQAILDVAAAEQERIDQQIAREQEEKRRAHEEVVEARRAFREQMHLLELAAGGASDGLVELVARVQDLDNFLEAQRAAGVRGTGKFRDLTLQGLLNDIMGPINEAINPLSEIDRIMQHYAEVREQVRFIAEEMGIAIEPLLALIDAAEAADLAPHMQIEMPFTDTSIIEIEVFADDVKKASKELKDMAESAHDAAEALQQARQDAYQVFQGLWKSITSVGLSPEQQVRAQFDELRAAFDEMGLAERRQFLRLQGFHPTNATSAGQLADMFDELIGPKEAKAIADAIADALGPLVDYFEDLRRSGAGQTQTQRFRNVFADFQAAIAGGDMEDAVALARLLTGEVGTGQFGSSSQAFRNLRDQIVAALSSTFGVPAPDLAGQNYQAASLGFEGRMATAAEQSVQIQRDGFADMIRRLDNIGRNLETAGRVR